MESNSSLNPNATSYVPLSKRVLDGQSEMLDRATKIIENSIHFGQGHDEKKACVLSNAHETEYFPFVGDFTLQSYHAQGSSSQHPTPLMEKLILDEVYDMDLEYLQMRFPGLSHQSLFDVYLANKSDVEASIDMLNDLEVNLDVYLFL